jgi:hypothetical protein
MNTTVNPKLNDLKQELVASLIEKEIINEFFSKERCHA